MLTPEERAELTQQLKEAKAARHALLIGEQAREFTDQNGERVTYTAANLNGLNAYIRDLERQLGIGCHDYRPIGFLF